MTRFPWAPLTEYRYKVVERYTDVAEPSLPFAHYRPFLSLGRRMVIAWPFEAPRSG